MYDTIDSTVKNGTLSFNRLQTTTSWTVEQSPEVNMFQTPNEYLQNAPAAGQK